MKRYLTWLFAVFGLLTFSACAAPTEAMLDASEARYKAIAPEYSNYIEHDVSLSEAQKQRRRDTLRTWEIEISAWRKQTR